MAQRAAGQCGRTTCAHAGRPGPRRCRSLPRWVMPAPSLGSTCNWIWVILGCCQGWVLSTSHTHTSCCYFGAAGLPPLLSPPLLLLKPQVGSWGLCLRILKSGASGGAPSAVCPCRPCQTPTLLGEAHPAAPLCRAGSRTPGSHQCPPAAPCPACWERGGGTPTPLCALSVPSKER